MDTTLTTLQQFALSGQAIVDAIDSTYEAESDETFVTTITAQSDFPIRMSSLGSCPRQLTTILEKRDMDEWREADPSAKRKWERGHVRETCLLDRLTRWLKENTSNPSIDRQLELTLPLDITQTHIDLIRVDWPGVIGTPETLLKGHLDMYVTDGTTGILIDPKSVASFTYRKLDTEGPSDGYVLQQAAYRRALREMGLRVDAAYLLYENADNMQLMAVPVPDGEAVDVRLDVALRLMSEAIRGDEPAYPEYAEKQYWNKPVHKAARGCLPWQCSYCKCGPLIGGCVDLTGHNIVDISSPSALVPKWEIS